MASFGEALKQIVNIEKAALDYLDGAAKSGKPFFAQVNFMKVHQPNPSIAREA